MNRSLGPRLPCVFRVVGIRSEAVVHGGIETFPKPPLLYNGPDTHIRHPKEDHMMRDAKPHSEPSPASRWCRSGLLGSAVLSLVVLAAACSGGSAGPGVAEGGSSSSPTASASSDGRTQALAYSQCMRDHGISDFPDPPEGQVNNPQLEEARSTVAEAEEACKDLSPEGDGGSTKDQAAALERALAYSQCMRDHGISGFPDPAYSNGGVVIPKNGKYDPLDPAVQQADAACLDALNPAHTSPTEAPGG
jgi:hypothetical protein